MAEESHGLFDWQVQTLMLAYDVVRPLPIGSEEEVVSARREAVEQELREMVRKLLPQEWHEDPERDLTPELAMRITRATLRRACAIVEGG